MKRLHRLRQNKHLRDLTATTEFSTAQLIQPLFVVQGLRGELPINGLKDTKRQSIENAIEQIEADVEKGVNHFILFPIPSTKQEKKLNSTFSGKVIQAIKKHFGQKVQLWVDTCLCSFTTHGHCCLFHENGNMHLEATLQTLANFAKAYADAGADGIAPSDMMDGRVAAIRKALDESGHSLIPIMSYSTKFASNFYGPFREAADSAPKFGDRKQYQIDVRNRQDAVAASVRCMEEGADLLMVKPGQPSMDLIQPIANLTNLAVGAYQVSGEFASLVLLEKEGLVNFEGALLESWQVLKRAGAQFIITYGARYAKEIGVPVPKP